MDSHVRDFSQFILESTSSDELADLQHMIQIGLISLESAIDTARAKGLVTFQTTMIVTTTYLTDTGEHTLYTAAMMHGSEMKRSELEVVGFSSDNLPVDEPTAQYKVGEVNRPEAFLSWLIDTVKTMKPYFLYIPAINFTWFPLTRINDLESLAYSKHYVPPFANRRLLAAIPSKPAVKKFTAFDLVYRVLKAEGTELTYSELAEIVKKIKHVDRYQVVSGLTFQTLDNAITRLLRAGLITRVTRMKAYDHGRGSYEAYYVKAI